MAEEAAWVPTTRAMAALGARRWPPARGGCAEVGHIPRAHRPAWGATLGELTEVLLEHHRYLDVGERVASERDERVGGSDGAESSTSA